PIILEAYHSSNEALSRRYWGRLQIKHGDPNCKAVLNKINQLAHKYADTRQASVDRLNIVLLKCQRRLSTEEASTSSSSYEDEEYYDPVYEDLMSMIEEDAMRFNKSYGNLKASIVLTSGGIVSDEYALEALFYRGKENLAEGNIRLGYFELGLVGSQMLSSGFSGLPRMRSNFKKTHYGKLRVEDDDTQNESKPGWVDTFMRWLPF
ncbi:NBS-containing resistance-like protein, partial [Trifolium medium]|nr:NBS-containing resistance-like protein [Trifolium medium]